MHNNNGYMAYGFYLAQNWNFREAEKFANSFEELRLNKDHLNKAYFNFSLREAILPFSENEPVIVILDGIDINAIFKKYEHKDDGIWAVISVDNMTIKVPWMML